MASKKRSKGRSVRTGHIVSHTHWDREWRYPIWETRLMLLDFMDELVEVLESGKYPSFLMDGQVAPVSDYLEIRPEMTQRVEKLVKDGKLLIGPWLVLPDEYPVDGEALVRNLLLGNRRAKALGRVLKIGYTPFGWGQTAQLPQIYAGFGIDVAMIGKRVNKERAPESEFIWRGPDGAGLLATRFGEMGRQNFYFVVHLSALFGVDHLGPDWRYDWSRGGIAYHRADGEQMEQDHFRLDAPGRWHPGTVTAEMAGAAWSTTDDSVLDNDRLMMNGCDYTASQPMFPEMVDKLNEADPDPGRRWVHTSLPEFVRLMKREIDRAGLRTVEGELRDGPAGPVTGNALTTRLGLKRLNKRAQNLLIRFAEPWTVLSAMNGAQPEFALVDKAWEFLLNAHPHDSINGVTQDKTVEDVTNRLRQVIDLSQALGNRAMQHFVRLIDTRGQEDGSVLLVVFNPLPYPRREIVEAYINVPRGAGASGEWPPGSAELQMYDMMGKSVPTQWEGRTEERYCVAEVHTRAFPFDCYRHRVFFDTGEVPAGGYKVFRAGAAAGPAERGRIWADAEARTGTLLKSPNVLENEYLRVEMNPNGTFNLTDKRIDRKFGSLNYYEDRGEHGDYWINKRPMFDQVHTSLGCSARIWAEVAGPLEATLVSEIALLLPRKGNKEQQKRSDETADLTIRTAVTLREGIPRVDVEVSFENRLEDHYLRAMFPTGLSEATHADVGGHFTVDHRPIRPQGPSADSVWPDMATLPQNNFVDVSDGQAGLAFLNDSLMEYEVLDNDERTTALSLLRCVRNWVCTESRAGSGWPSQKGGQMLGKHRFRYAMLPHAGDWKTANVPLAAEDFNVPLRIVQTRRNEGVLPGDEASLFSIDNTNLRLSALKKTQDRNSYILRVYNPTGKVQKGKVRLAVGISRAWFTDLNEKRNEKATVGRDGSITVTAASHRIITIELRTTR